MIIGVGKYTSKGGCADNNFNLQNNEEFKILMSKYQLLCVDNFFLHTVKVINPAPSLSVKKQFEGDTFDEALKKFDSYLAQKLQHEAAPIQQAIAHKI